MTEPLDLEGIKARIERARAELGLVCVEGPRNRFRMSLPANPDRDTDLILGSALADAYRVVAEVERLAVQVNDIGCELDEEAKDRQEYEELLDKFAYAVAPIEVIGEHTSGNDPWANALDMLTPASEVDRLRQAIELLGSHLQGGAQALIDALAEVGRLRGFMVEAFGKLEAEKPHEAESLLREVLYIPAVSD